jgi:hypothetical protein
MPFDGSGVYTVPAGTVGVEGEIISPTAYNDFLADLETSLSECMLRNGVSAMAANLDMGGFRIRNMAAGSLAGDAVRYDQVFPKIRASAFPLTEYRFTPAAADTTIVLANTTSALVCFAPQSGIPSISSFGAGPIGPMYVRVISPMNFVPGTALRTPTGETYTVPANGSFIVVPFSTTSSSTPNAWKMIAYTGV